MTRSIDDMICADVLTFEEFAGIRNASRLGLVEAGLHCPKAHISETANRRNLRELDKCSVDLINRRAALREEYKSLIEAGKIRMPTRAEVLLKRARGHDDNRAVQAARVVLAKQGLWPES